MNGQLMRGIDTTRKHVKICCISAVIAEIKLKDTKKVHGYQIGQHLLSVFKYVERRPLVLVDAVEYKLV